MQTSTIIALIVIGAIVAAAIIIKSKKKSSGSTASGAAAPTPAPAPAPAQATTALHAADYAASFFSGALAGVPIHPYTLPTGAKGYGAGGAYDKNAYDPAFYDATRERINAANGTCVDVPGLKVVFTDGTTSAVTREQMRAWLYGLSINPSSVNTSGPGGLLALALLNAPRSLDKVKPGAGQGSFG